MVIIGLDCPGAFSNADFRAFADQHETPDAATRTFCTAVFSDETNHEAVPLTSACRACSHPIPDGADIAVNFSAATRPTD